MNRLAKVAFGFVIATMVLAGCGASLKSSDGYNTATSSSVRTVFVALKDFTISPAVVDVPAGTVKFTAVNQGQAFHNFSVKLTDGGNRITGTANLSPGQTGSVRVRLQRGTYIGYCSEPGHESLGMKISIVVR